MASNIFLSGINHHNTPVKIREQLTLTGDGLRLALKTLKKWHHPGTHGFVLLSTCNRLELYMTAANEEEARWVFTSFINHFYGLDAQFLNAYLYVYEGDEAILHLMRVAAGLESMILGESQILGQVATAFSKARQEKITDTFLSRLFEQAIKVGKRARSETSLAKQTTSISSAAALLAKSKLGQLDQVKTLIIGAGEMGALAAQSLYQQGARHFIIINRSMERSIELAAKVNGTAMNWLNLPKAISQTDLIISATNAPHTVLSVANFVHVLPERNEVPLLIIDIAVPRDIDDAVRDLPGIELVNIDDLQSIVNEHLALREAEIPLVNGIIEQEISDFKAWVCRQEVLPTILDMRQKVELIAETEVNKTLRSLKNTDPEMQETIKYLAQRITQKILHSPTICLKSYAQSEDRAMFTQVVHQLFELNNECGERDYE